MEHEVQNQDPSVEVRLKEPKKIIYCSDGVLEEFSEDDEDKDEVVKYYDLQNPPKHSWIVNQFVQTAKTTLGVCDYIGESFASFFGILTPRFPYKIEECSDEETRQKRMTEEKNKGWVEWRQPDEIILQPKSQTFV